MKKLLLFIAFLPLFALAQGNGVIYLGNGVYGTKSIIPIPTIEKCPCEGDGVAPFVSFGIAAGTSPTGLSVSGDNKSGIISFTTDNGGAIGELISVTFDVPYTSNVHVICVPEDDITTQYFYAQGYHTKSGFNDHFEIFNYSLAFPIPPGITLKITYIVQK